MNKRERLAAAALAARWEWGSSGGSSSEAAAYGSCARELIKTLGIDDDTTNFARAWEIAKHGGFTDDDDAFDALTDMIEASGYDAVVDLIEDVDFDGLRAALVAKEQP
ncbi:hypothetical protein C7441_112120 [Pseudaminobacter salicylatoxidans]|uniref:Uncharacterized protein n=1 Tax=Pseudaminobacter salicylatoxidans TaxID=93369 RepID=A0A316C140_PSESE|nr:hypothetical protein [Pseudaminobacter salicylatoxidans]PWJ80578.1 hypothetical protein C7441_112120 [Pseudaminobacter salicylatoxidans]